MDRPKSPFVVGAFDLENNIETLMNVDLFLNDLILESKSNPADLKEGCEIIDQIRRQGTSSQEFKRFQKKVLEIAVQLGFSVGSIADISKDAKLVKKSVKDIVDEYKAVLQTTEGSAAEQKIKLIKLKNFERLVTRINAKGPDQILRLEDVGQGSFISLKEKVINIRKALTSETPEQEIIEEFKVSQKLIDLVKAEEEEFKQRWTRVEKITQIKPADKIKFEEACKRINTDDQKLMAKNEKEEEKEIVKNLAIRSEIIKKDKDLELVVSKQIRERIDNKKSDEEIIKKLRVSRDLVESSLDFYEIDQAIRDHGDLEFSGQTFHTLRTAIINVKKAIQSEYQSQQNNPVALARSISIPRRPVAPIAPVQPRQSSEYLSPFRLLLEESNKRAVKNGGAIMSEILPGWSSAELDGAFSAVMMNPNRNELYHFFKPLFSNDQKDKTDKSTLLLLLKKNKKSAETIIAILFEGKPYPGQEYAFQAFMEFHFIPLLQGYLNKGQKQDTLKAFKLIMENSRFFLQLHHNLYLNTAGFFELINVFDTMTKLKDKLTAHLRSLINNKSKKMSPAEMGEHRQTISTINQFLLEVDNILYSILKNSTTTLNPLNPKIDVQGQKRILSHLIKNVVYLDLLRKWCNPAKNGSVKLIIDCFDYHLESLLRLQQDPIQYSAQHPQYKIAKILDEIFIQLNNENQKLIIASVMSKVSQAVASLTLVSPASELKVDVSLDSKSLAPNAILDIPVALSCLAACFISRLASEHAWKAKGKDPEKFQLDFGSYFAAINEWGEPNLFLFMLAVAQAPIQGPMILQLKKDLLNLSINKPVNVFMKEQFEAFAREQQVLSFDPEQYYKDSLKANIIDIVSLDFAFDKAFRAEKIENYQKTLTIIHQLEILARSKSSESSTLSIVTQLSKLASLENGLEIFWGHIHKFSHLNPIIQRNILDLYMLLFFPNWMHRPHDLNTAIYGPGFRQIEYTLEKFREVHGDGDFLERDQRQASVFFGLVGAPRRYLESIGGIGRPKELAKDFCLLTVEYFARQNDLKKLHHFVEWAIGRGYDERNLKESSDQTPAFFAYLLRNPSFSRFIQSTEPDYYHALCSNKLSKSAPNSASREGKAESSDEFKDRLTKSKPSSSPSELKMELSEEIKGIALRQDEQLDDSTLTRDPLSMLEIILSDVIGKRSYFKESKVIKSFVANILTLLDLPAGTFYFLEIFKEAAPVIDGFLTEIIEQKQESDSICLNSIKNEFKAFDHLISKNQFLIQLIKSCLVLFINKEHENIVLKSVSQWLDYFWSKNPDILTKAFIDLCESFDAKQLDLSIRAQRKFPLYRKLLENLAWNSLITDTEKFPPFFILSLENNFKFYDYYSRFDIRDPEREQVSKFVNGVFQYYRAITLLLESENDLEPHKVLLVNHQGQAVDFFMEISEGLSAIIPFMDLTSDQARTRYNAFKTDLTENKQINTQKLSALFLAGFGLDFQQEMLNYLTQIFKDTQNYQFCLKYLDRVVFTDFNLNLHVKLYQFAFWGLLRAAAIIPHYRLPNVELLIYRHIRIYTHLVQNKIQTANQKFNYIDFINQEFITDESWQIPPQAIQFKEPMRGFRSELLITPVLAGLNELLESTTEESKTTPFDIEELHSAFILEAVDFALEFISEEKNEFCGLLESRAAPIAVKYKDKLSLDDKTIYLYILAILKEKDPKNQIDGLLEKLEDKSAYKKKLISYLQLKSLNSKIALPDIIPPERKSSPKKSVKFSELVQKTKKERNREAEIIAPHLHFFTDYNPICSQGAVIGLILKSEPNQDLDSNSVQLLSALEDRLGQENNDKSEIQNQLITMTLEEEWSCNLMQYFDAVCQPGFEYVDLISDKMISEISRTDYAPFRTTQGKTLNAELVQALSFLGPKNLGLLEVIESNISNNIHTYIASGIILLRLARAYKSPYVIGPSPTENRIISSIVSNLKLHLEILSDENLNVSPRAKKECFQTLRWLAREISPKNFTKGRTPIDAVYITLNEVSSDQDFECIHHFLMHWDLILPESIWSSESSFARDDLRLNFMGEFTRHAYACMPKEKILLASSNRDDKTLLEIIYENHPFGCPNDFKFDQKVSEILEKGHSSDQSVYNQYLFALAYNHPNRYLGFCFAGLYQKFLEKQDYYKNKGVSLWAAYRRHIQRTEYHVARGNGKVILLHGIFAAFNAPLSELKRPSKDETAFTALTHSFKEKLDSLFKIHLSKTFTSERLSKLNEFARATKMSREPESTFWIDYFIGLLETLLADQSFTPEGYLNVEKNSHLYGRLRQALFKLDNVEQNAHLRAWCFRLMTYLPNDQGKGFIELMRVQFLKQLTHTDKALEDCKQESKYSLRDCLNIFKQAEKLHNEEYWHHISLEVLHEENTKSLIEHSPLEVALTIMQGDKQRLLGAWLFYLLQIEEPSAVMTTILKAQDYDFIKNQIIASCEAEIKSFANPCTDQIEKIFFALMSHCRILKAPDLLEIQEAFKASGKKRAYVYSWMAEIILKAGRGIQEQKTPLKLFVKARKLLSSKEEKSLEVRSFEEEHKLWDKITDIELNIQKLISPAGQRYSMPELSSIMMRDVANAKLMMFLRANLRSFSLDELHINFSKIILTKFASALKDKAKVIKGVSEFVSDQDFSKSISIVEEFLTYNFFQSEDKKDDGFLLMAIPEIYRPIFSTWVQLLWRFHSSKLSDLIAYLDSNLFIADLKRLIEEEKNHPFIKTVAVLDYLLELAEKIDNLIIYQALYKAERIYWRTHKWKVRNNHRTRFLSHSCLAFVDTNDYKGLPAEIGKHKVKPKLFTELAGKIAFEATKPEAKWSMPSANSLGGILDVFLANILTYPEIKNPSPRIEKIEAFFVRMHILPPIREVKRSSQERSGKLLELIRESLECVDPEDSCWRVAMRLLNAINGETKQDAKSSLEAPLTQFTRALIRMLQKQGSNSLAQEEKKQLMISFLLLLQKKFINFKISSSSENARTLKQLDKSLDKLESDLENKDMTQVDALLKTILISISRLEGISPDKRPYFITTLRAYLKMPEGCGKIIDEIRGEINTIKYRGGIFYRRKLMESIVEILDAAGLPSTKISVPNEWAKFFGDNHCLQDLQSAFCRWEQLAPLLEAPSQDAKDLKLTQSRVQSDYNSLLNEGSGDIFDSKCFGDPNGDAEIITRFFKFYLTHGGKVPDAGVQTTRLLSHIKNKLTEDDYFNRALDLIFSILKEDRFKQNAFMEMLFLHWNALTRKNLSKCDNEIFNSFSNDLVRRINIAYAAFQSNDGNLLKYKLYCTSFEGEIRPEEFKEKPILIKQGQTIKVLGFKAGRWQTTELAAASLTGINFTSAQRRLLSDREIVETSVFSVIKEKNGHFQSHFLPGSFFDLINILALNSQVEPEILNALEDLMRDKFQIEESQPEDKSEEKPERDCKKTIVTRQVNEFRIKMHTLGTLFNDSLPEGFKQSCESVLPELVKEEETPERTGRPLTRPSTTGLRSLLSGSNYTTECIGFTLPEFLKSLMLITAIGPEPLGLYCSTALTIVSKFNLREFLGKTISNFSGKENIIQSLLLGMLRANTRLNAEAEGIQKMEFPEFNAYADWYQQFVWFCRLLAPDQKQIAEVFSKFSEAKQDGWPNSVPPKLQAIENRYLQLLPDQQKIMRAQLQKAIPEDIKIIPGLDKSCVLGLTAIWRKSGKLSISAEGLFFNYNEFGRFLEDVYLSQPSIYFPFAGKEGVLTEIDAKDFDSVDGYGKINLLLTHSHLNAYFLQAVAESSPDDKLNEFYLKIETPGEMKGIDLYQEKITAIVLKAYEALKKVLNPQDKILNTHLEKFKQRFDSAFEQKRSGIHDKVKILNEFLIIFQGKFKNRPDLSDQFYRYLLEWSLDQWLRTKLDTELCALIEVFQFAKFLPLTMKQLRWQDDFYSLPMVSKSGLGPEIIDKLSEKGFTHWSLIEDFLLARPLQEREMQPFDIRQLIEIHLTSIHKGAVTNNERLEFFNESFDEDVYNATSFVACVLRQLGMDSSKHLVRYSDMAAKGHLQSQLIAYLQNLLPDYNSEADQYFRLQGFIRLLLGRRILLLDREPLDPEKQWVIENKCIFLIKKSEGYYLGVRGQAKKFDIGLISIEKSDQKALDNAMFQIRLNPEFSDCPIIIKQDDQFFISGKSAKEWELQKLQAPELKQIVFSAQIQKPSRISIPENIYEEIFSKNAHQNLARYDQWFIGDDLELPDNITQEDVDNDFDLRQTILDYLSVVSVDTFGPLESWPEAQEVEKYKLSFSLDCIPRLSSGFEESLTEALTGYNLYLSSSLDESNLPVNDINGQRIKGPAILLTNEGDAYFVKNNDSFERNESKGLFKVSEIDRQSFPLEEDNKEAKEVRVIQKTEPLDTVNEIIRQVTSLAGRTFLPNVEISSIRQGVVKSRFLFSQTPIEKKWRSSMLPIATGHRIGRYLKSKTLETPELEKAYANVELLIDKHWLPPLRSVITLRAYEDFIYECIRKIKEEISWEEQFTGLLTLIQQILGISLKKNIASPNFIYAEDYTNIIMKFFDVGMGKFSSLMLGPSMVLPPHQELEAPFLFDHDVGIMRQACGKILQAEDFKQHCLLRLDSLIKSYTVDATVFDPSNEKPRGLIVEAQIPEGDIPESWRGKFVLISQLDSPFFKLEGQHSKGNYQIAYANPFYLDAKGNRQRVYRSENAKIADYCDLIILTEIKNVNPINKKENTGIIILNSQEIKSEYQVFINNDEAKQMEAKPLKNLEVVWTKEIKELTPNHYGKLIFEVPKIAKTLTYSFKGQDISSRFLSNFYYVDESGRRYGVVIPRNHIKYFDEQLRKQLGKKRELTPAETEKLIHQLRKESEKDRAVECFQCFGLNVGISKFLRAAQGAGTIKPFVIESSLESKQEHRGKPESRSFSLFAGGDRILLGHSQAELKQELADQMSSQRSVPVSARVVELSSAPQPQAELEQEVITDQAPSQRPAPEKEAEGSEADEELDQEDNPDESMLSELGLGFS